MFWTGEPGVGAVGTSARSFSSGPTVSWEGVDGQAGEEWAGLDRLQPSLSVMSLHASLLQSSCRSPP